MQLMFHQGQNFLPQEEGFEDLRGRSREELCCRNLCVGGDLCVDRWRVKVLFLGGRVDLRGIGRGCGGK